MMRVRVTREDAARAIQRLSTVYPLRRGTTVEGLSAIWADALEGIEPGELRAAVDAILREYEGRWFPTPHQVRQYAVRERGSRVDPGDLRTIYGRWTEGDGPCPVCRESIRLLTAEERGARPGSPHRYGVLHDASKHRAVGIPPRGLAREPLREAR